MSTQNQVMNKAISYLGTKESPADSNNVIFNTHYYGYSVYGSAYPWCCAFVWDIFRMSGASSIFYDGQKTAYCPTVRNWGNSRGYVVPKNQARYGDIVLFDWGGDGVADHIGFVESFNGSTYTCIEGNTSVGNDSNGGCVMRRTRYASSIQCIIRPRYDGVTSTEISGGTVSNRNWLQQGDTGSEVRAMQKMLIACGYSCGSYGADGDFGSGTLSAVKKFQSQHGLTVDGEYGVNSKAKLESLYKSHYVSTDSTIVSTTSYSDWTARLQKECNTQGFSNQKVDGEAGPNTLAGCPILKRGAQGNITRLLQERLNTLGYPCGAVDGVFGGNTLSAVRSFQKARGLVVDGEVGKKTWAKLLGI